MQVIGHWQASLVTIVGLPVRAGALAEAQTWRGGDGRCEMWSGVTATSDAG
ncbi:hypothetical protein CHELA1G11_10323 [Hyphomicrobiales bacterium]|nr:hypothetical protein CHELA1G11_10323 [Hyphomicrobiales bacterium]CAH1675483.1 hypothetical protein CHELA1G2_13982 [Hyphomicrobiales bacterium]